MKKSIYICCVLLISLGSLAAQQLPNGGIELIPQQRLERFSIDKDSLGKVEIISINPLTAAFSTHTQPKFIYKLSASIPLKKELLKKGQIMLLGFEAKTTASSLETGEAKALWIVRQSESHKDNLERSVSIGSEWRQYYFPIRLTKPLSKSNFKLVVQFGYPPQQFQLRGLSFLAFPPETKEADLPKTKLSYAGEEEGAAWRRAALERIEQHRKGDMKLRFVDKKGRPIENTPIRIELKKHHTGFGTAVHARKLLDEPEHIEKIAETFGQVVFANDLKIKAWQRPDQPEIVAAVVARLHKRGLNVKGHVLIWPGFQYLTPDFRSMRGQPEKVEKRMAEHIDDILRKTRGSISHWDVVNEAYTNRDLQKITGSEEIIYNGFRKVKASDPDLLCFTNEYGIISKGGLDRQKQEWYYDFVKRIDENTGGMVDGIGIQCHIGSDLTPPEKVLDILDYFAGLDKKIAISEFTMDIDDDDLRYRYTRDFMIAAYSHPSVSEFMFWGYYGPESPKAALFDENLNPLPMGKAFLELVYGQWKTDLASKSNGEGSISERGFFGTYRYQFVQKNQLVEGTFEFLPGREAEIIIEVK